MKPSAPAVTVRMYRTRVGDCFLLRFPGRDGEAFHMLIDCGIHSQCKGGSEHIRKVVRHINETTGGDEAKGGHLNLVVVTHEHGDHVSGFYLAAETFAKMTIDEAWFGWTEDPNDQRAKDLDRVRKLMLNGLRAARLRLDENDPLEKKIRPLLGFFEMEGLAVSSREARDKIAGQANQKRYLKPKIPPLTLPGVDGVRIFVLGPPEDVKSLMRARPSKTAGEVYEEEALAHALMAAGGARAGAMDYARGERYQPVPGNHRLPLDLVRAQRQAHKFFHQKYGFSEKHKHAWRRIDDDWLNPTESLALKLDSATNNTSLVLAIELQKSGRVLLFPGDAQVGNWHSWHEGGWSESNGLKKGETISAENLLNRTVLYKVGHHGSHNATLRGKGLEMMTSPELTAMIPVDQEWAEDRRPYPWKMPFDPLYADLMTRTGGRILRSDQSLVTPPNDAVWGPFKARAEELYVEIDIPDD